MASDGPRIGSIASGMGGLCELALASYVGGTVAWHAEIDPDASKVLAHHWPHTPNLGNIKETDWSSVEGVDWLTAGWPCQPWSLAGKRAGADDERHLWPYVAYAISTLRPRWFFGENVAGHLSMGFDDVLGSLTAMGYDTRWGVVRASDAGAPHQRARLFVVAADTRDRTDHRKRSCPEPGEGSSTPPNTRHGGVVDRSRPPGGRAGNGYQSGQSLDALLATPRANEANGVGLHGQGGQDLRTQISLLPTPAANDSGNTPQDHLRKKPGRQQVTSLQIIVDHDLLSTGGRIPPPSPDGNTDLAGMLPLLLNLDAMDPD